MKTLSFKQFLVLSASIAFLGCSGSGFEALTSQNLSSSNGGESPLPPPDTTVDGKILYERNCQGCHGGIEFSAIKGKSETQIRTALTSVSQMRALPPLDASQVRAIYLALNVAPPPPEVTPPSTTADETFSRLNPGLYQLARKYFPASSSDYAGARIFRLTLQQIDNSVKALLPSFYQTSLSVGFPSDILQTNYEFAELIRFNALNMNYLVTWIDGIATRVRANPTAVINCTSQNNSTTCLQSRARDFVGRAFRGDVTTAQLDRFSQFFLSSVSAVGVAEATGDLVEVVLSSPQFLFRKETTTDNNYRLSSTQVLQNVAYTLADNPPEALSLASSSASTLVGTPTQIQSTVQNLSSNVATREKLVRFFKRWLEVKDPKDFAMKAEDFPEFTPTVAEEVVNETDRFLRHHLTKVAPKLKDVTQSTESFVSRSIASIYDMNGTTLTGTSPVPLDTSKRVGVFTQSAVIASHSGANSTRPVKRGVFWVNKLLCLGVEPPPSSLDTSVPDTSAAVTERQRLEIATNQSACIGCHKVINPFGFMYENYNSIGKWRTLDNGVTIDSSVSTNILDEGSFQTTDPVVALKTFTNSALFKQCFVRQVFRFYMGRKEEPKDEPVLREAFMYFADGDQQDILTLVRILASSDRMTHRR